MYYQRLSDEEILSGFREGDADIIRSGTLPRYYQHRGSLPYPSAAGTVPID